MYWVHWHLQLHRRIFDSRHKSRRWTSFPFPASCGIFPLSCYTWISALIEHCKHLLFMWLVSGLVVKNITSRCLTACQITTPWNMVLDKLTSAQFIMKFGAFEPESTLMCSQHATASLYPESRGSSPHSNTHLFRIHFNGTILSMPRSPKYLSPSAFPASNLCVLPEIPEMRLN